MAYTETVTPSNEMATRVGDCTYNNLFVSAYGKPSWDALIAKTAEKYNLPQILEYIGEGVAESSTLNWAEEGAIFYSNATCNPWYVVLYSHFRVGI